MKTLLKKMLEKLYHVDLFNAIFIFCLIILIPSLFVCLIALLAKFIPLIAAVALIALAAIISILLS